jgi:uncharacterized membrane protein
MLGRKAYLFHVQEFHAVSHSSLRLFMDFLLWSARSLHIFSVVVWFGGLMYEAAVTVPVTRAEAKELDPLHLHLIKRFRPFVWMSVWTILVTGSAMMLFNPRFVFFKYPDSWSLLLAFKQIVFALMILFSFGYGRMFNRVHDLLAANEPSEIVMRFYRQMVAFGRINVGLGIAALLLAAGMNS